MLCKGFQFAFPRFCYWWDAKPSGGISFIFRGFCFHFRLMDLKLTPSFVSLFFLFAYRMERGYKEVSNSQVECQRGTPWETPTASSLVATMSTEELRLYN